MDTSIVKSKDAWRIGLAQQLNAASYYTVLNIITFRDNLTLAPCYSSIQIDCMHCHSKQPLVVVEI